MKIAVVGLGYVGLSNAVLLSQHNRVYAVDISEDKVNSLQNKKSPIIDKDIQSFLSQKTLHLEATLNETLAFVDADFVIIATPTDYNENENYFDTGSVESVIQRIIQINKNYLNLIKVL